jgi:hypothetical protein
MFDVDTLFVISSARGQYALNDLISSIRWACPSGSTYTVAVDETGDLDTLSADGEYKLLSVDVPKEADSGFKRAAGLKWAIDQGISYKQVVMLDDSCLVMGQPFDAFLSDQLTKDGVGLLGVRDTVGNHEKAFHQNTTLLYEWQVPNQQQLEIAPPVLCDAFLALSARFVGALYQKNLLTPDACERWDGTFGSYLSWLCTMTGFFMVSWGSADKSLPPFHVSHGGNQPSPTVLAQRFLVFSSVRDVLGYGESDLRELFKRQRGEPSREVPPFSPVVTGPGLPPA